MTALCTKGLLTHEQFVRAVFASTRHLGLTSVLFESLYR